jgi:filamentous hemagglutinin family protein
MAGYSLSAVSLATLPVLPLIGLVALPASALSPLPPETVSQITLSETTLNPSLLEVPPIAPSVALANDARTTNPDDGAIAMGADDRPLLMAQVTPDSDTTRVNQRTTTTGSDYVINGGQRSQDGRNLFHSFDDFRINEGDRARFNTTTDVQNVLGRVTGGNASLIDGALQLTGSNANLYLINPAGIVFGSNASLDVPSSFMATTATGIQFNGEWFSAVGDNDYSVLTGNPQAFAFTEAQPGAIASSANLRVNPGRSLTLLGGSVVNTGTLAAPGGDITITSVPDRQVVRFSQTGQLLSLEVSQLDGATADDINPVPFTARQLPQLLTAPAVRNATGIQVNADGVLQLTGAGIQLDETAGMTVVSGTVNASRTVNEQNGGNVTILGDRTAVVSASIQASGEGAGGSIRIGGDRLEQRNLPESSRTLVTGTALSAEGEFGDGGLVVVSADGRTWVEFSSISAVSFIANGGAVEILGADHLDYRGTTTVSDIGADGARGRLTFGAATIEVVETLPVPIPNAVNQFNAINSSPPPTSFILASTLSSPDIADLTIQSSGNLIVNGAIALGGDEGGDALRLLANETLTVNAAITDVNGANLTLRGNQQVEITDRVASLGGRIAITGRQQRISSDVNASSGNIILNARDVRFQTAALSSSGGELRIQPIRADQPLTVRSTSPTVFQDGFQTIIIGRSDGSGQLTIASDFTFNDPITLRSPNGSISINGEINALGGQLRIVGSGNTTTITENITTAGTPIVINDSLILADDITFSTTGSTTDGADVTVTGRINGQEGGESFQILAGTGNVSLGGAIGTETPLGNLSLEGNTVNLNGDLITRNRDIIVDAARLLLRDSVELDAGLARIDLVATDVNIRNNNLTLTANEIDFGDLAIDTSGPFVRFRSGAIRGTGALVLQPTTPDRPINIGIFSETPDALDITFDELDVLQDGLESITIGRSDGSGEINITPESLDPILFQDLEIAELNISVSDPLILRSPEGDGSITAFGDIDGDDSDVSVTLLANQDIVTRDISAPAGISIVSTNGSVNARPGTLDTSRTFGDAGSVFIEADGSVQVSNINTQSENDGAAGDITITGQTIDTSQGLLLSVANDEDGGEIILSADGDIRTAAIVSASNLGDGGEIILDSESGSIDTLGPAFSRDELSQIGDVSISISGATELVGILSGSINGTGGDITVRAEGDITTGNLVSTSLFGDRAGTIRTISRSGTINTRQSDSFFAATRGEFYSFSGIDAGSTDGSGGDVIQNSAGAVIDGDINTSAGRNGGDVSIVADRRVRTGAIDASGQRGDGGDVVIDSGGDVDVRFIDARGGQVGGDVEVTAGRFFRAIDAFRDSSTGDFLVSISTAGGLQGGSITIRHGGSADFPFTVGPRFNGVNGTFGIITTGDDNFIATGSFPSNYIQGAAPNQIQILTEPRTVPPDRRPHDNDPSPPIDDNNFDTNILEVRNILLDILANTGVRPALVYVQFVPSSATSIASTEAVMSSDIEADFQRLEETFTQEVSAYYDLPGRDRGFPIAIDDSLDQLEIILISATGDPTRYRPGVTRSQLMEIAREFQQNISDPLLTRSNTYEDSAQQLYEWIVAPMQADLIEQEVDNLVFISSPGLRSLPYAALQDPLTGRFLVEDYSVGTMPSLSLTDTRYVDIRQSAVLAMGASEFTDQNPLPAVPLELQSIFVNEQTNEVLWEGTGFLNEEFTLDNLRTQREQTPFGIVHLATHGEFRRGEPDNSYIQLSDTRLQLDQLRQLNWTNPPVELLVLSACRTALGDEEAELGFAGLAAQTGVRSVLGSLWYVSDLGTLALIDEFYEQLRIQPIRAQALQQAQIAMLNGQVQLPITEDTDISEVSDVLLIAPERLRHPYYWSSFTFVGNPW